MIQASNYANELAPKLDTIIFDMDGVLLDISQSIRRVNSLAVSFYLREIVGIPAPDDLLSSDDIERFKHAGGFNDDWDLTYALVLYYLVKHHENPETDAVTLSVTGLTLGRYAFKIGEKGGGVTVAEDYLLGNFMPRDRATVERDYSKPKIRQVFQELLGGDLCQRIYGIEPKYYTGRGLIYEDKVLLDKALIPDGFKLGMQTGRTYTEAEVGIEFCGLQETLPEETWITKRDGYHKPDPGGLRTLARRLGTETAGIYIGDTLDDLRTVRALNAKSKVAPFLIALVLTGPAGSANRKLFEKNGADIIGDNVNEVLAWINEARQ
ncbi:MAG TPA: HAD family hydrolase [Capsulimonadaceae bacterium]|jgi:HAD superfamily hydrolase (TIGR01548 family)